MARVLRPSGRVLVLESSRVAAPLSRIYDFYSFQVLPRLGQWIAGDYRHLAESIRVHPDQSALKTMMKAAGFGHVEVRNLSAGQWRCLWACAASRHRPTGLGTW